MKQSALLLWMVLFFQLNGKAQETQCYIQDPKAVPREHAADFTHTLIDIRIVPEMGKVVGSVTHQFEPLRKSVDSLFIDGPGISVKTARLDQKSVQWKANDQGITFFFDRPLSWGTEH